MRDDPMVTALLLMAHGSRNEAANDDLRRLADEIHGAGEYPVVVASFLELAVPSIPEGGRVCVAQGANRVVMAPYFLSAGVHVRRDLQAFRDLLRTEFPAVAFTLAEPMGRHPLLREVVLQRAREAAE